MRATESKINRGCHGMWAGQTEGPQPADALLCKHLMTLSSTTHGAPSDEGGDCHKALHSQEAAKTGNAQGPVPSAWRHICCANVLKKTIGLQQVVRAQGRKDAITLTGL